MSNDTITDLLACLRSAKHLLATSHPTCAQCGHRSVGCYDSRHGVHRIVIAVCEDHWGAMSHGGLLATWRVRWDDFEDTGVLESIDREAKQ